VKSLSDAVLAYKGNWLESSLSRLRGHFAGIVHISVPADSKTELLSQFEKLAAEGIQVTLQDTDLAKELDSEREPLDILVEANDRPGIVDEIASALSSSNINVDHMTTECVSASMAGYELFRAHLQVTLPKTCSLEILEQTLENVSDDLIVSVNIDD
ncbi:MAG: ACT domain-containing protein, partial [Acidiferrobacterales bacterium]|nr:ACT domain-containing protein [Acidiferrobacterales bacterium]